MNTFLVLIFLFGVAPVLLGALLGCAWHFIFAGNMGSGRARPGSAAPAIPPVRGTALLTAARGDRNVPPAQLSPPTPVTLRRECAWCKQFLGGDPASPQITHGICPACAANWDRDIAGAAVSH